MEVKETFKIPGTDILVEAGSNLRVIKESDGYWEDLLNDIEAGRITEVKFSPGYGGIVYQEKVDIRTLKSQRGSIELMTPTFYALLDESNFTSIKELKTGNYTLYIDKGYFSFIAKR